MIIANILGQMTEDTRVSKWKTFKAIQKQDDGRM